MLKKINNPVVLIVSLVVVMASLFVIVNTNQLDKSNYAGLKSSFKAFMGRDQKTSIKQVIEPTTPYPNGLANGGEETTLLILQSEGRTVEGCPGFCNSIQDLYISEEEWEPGIGCLYTDALDGEWGETGQGELCDTDNGAEYCPQGVDNCWYSSHPAWDANYDEGSWDDATCCTMCGDGSIDGNEECDPGGSTYTIVTNEEYEENIPISECVDYNSELYVGGTVGCTNQCTDDLSECYSCQADGTYNNEDNTCHFECGSSAVCDDEDKEPDEWACDGNIRVQCCAGDEQEECDYKCEDGECIPPWFSLTPVNFQYGVWEYQCSDLGVGAFSCNQWVETDPRTVRCDAWSLLNVTNPDAGCLSSGYKDGSILENYVNQLAVEQEGLNRLCRILTTLPDDDIVGEAVGEPQNGYGENTMVWNEDPPYPATGPIWAPFTSYYQGVVTSFLPSSFKCVYTGITETEEESRLI